MAATRARPRHSRTELALEYAAGAPVRKRTPDDAPLEPPPATRAASGASGSLRGDQIPVPAERGLRRALPGAEVDVHEAESLVVALGPLEVVHQRPGQVAAYVDAGRDGLVQCPEVAVQVPDPRLVIDGPVGGYHVIG